MVRQPLVVQSVLIVEASRLHSYTPHTVLLLWTSDQLVKGPLFDKTQHPKETDIHVPGRIRTRIHSKQAAVNPRLRPDGTGIVEFNTQ
jgi:hypothetical protein